MVIPLKKKRSRKPIKLTPSSGGNVSCRVVTSIDDSSTRVILEALDYDTFWKLYLVKVLDLPIREDLLDIRMFQYIAQYAEYNEIEEQWYFSFEITDIARDLDVHVHDVMSIYNYAKISGYILDVGSAYAVSDLLLLPVLIQKRPGIYTYMQEDSDIAISFRVHR